MNEFPLCTIAFSSEVPSEIESLKNSLKMTGVKLQTQPSRVVGIDDLVLIVSGAAATAQLIDYGIKVGKAINNWRRKCKDKGIETLGKLEHPDGPTLDFKTATDEEVEAWFKEIDKWLAQ